MGEVVVAKRSLNSEKELDGNGTEDGERIQQVPCCWAEKLTATTVLRNRSQTLFERRRSDRRSKAFSHTEASCVPSSPSPESPQSFSKFTDVVKVSTAKAEFEGCESSVSVKDWVDKSKPRYDLGARVGFAGIPIMVVEKRR